MQGGMKRRHPHKTNVLLVNITRLGDMLQATPTIAGMKMENPDCKVTVLVEKQFEGICKVIPNIDEIVALDLGMTVRSLAREADGIIDAYEYLSEVVDELKEADFDYCLNMSSSAYTALLLRLIGVDRRGGWSSDDEGHRVIESEWARLFAASVFHQNREFNSLNLVDVFRCSADVEQHPNHLMINVEQDDLDYCNQMISEFGFTNTGPIISIQAGASQGKRQWAPRNFIKLIKILTEEHNYRVVLTGTKKELGIIEPIKEGVANPNVGIAAGRTNLSQLSALLKISDLLITGDTGPMHMCAAVKTPLISMFLASAYGFETGPYGEGHLILQPVIGCGPCNPNKNCARPDCHDHISPELMAELAVQRLQGPIDSIPDSLADPSQVIIYQSFFDDYGFCDLKALNSDQADYWKPYRNAYRKLWMDELAGFKYPDAEPAQSSALQVVEGDGMEGLDQIVERAKKGQTLIMELKNLIMDSTATAAQLGEVSETLTELDREVEQIGFLNPYLGPLARMFIFGKENLSGSDALELASQMGEVYCDLERRGEKLGQYFQQVN